MASYLTDKVKSKWVLKKLATHELCYVKSWMTAEENSTAEVVQ